MGTWVYRYVYWDERSASHIESSTYATVVAIRDGLGLPLYDTGRVVPDDEVEGGIYRPRAASSKAH